MSATHQPPTTSHAVSHTSKEVSVWLNGLKENKKNSNKKTKDPKAISWLFERFSIIWGNKWDKSYDDKPEAIAEEWTDALAGLSRQALKQGLANTRQALAWPPTIAEFLQASQGVEVKEDVNHFLCNIPGCANPGTMCRSTHGNNWICNQHYMQGK